MRLARILSLALLIACLGFANTAQRVAAQEISGFRVPAPVGLPICPFHIVQLDEVGFPFQFGMPCGMASLAHSPKATEAEVVECFDEFESSPCPEASRPGLPAPAMSMSEFEDLTPSINITAVEGLVRQALASAKQTVLLLSPDHIARTLGSQLDTLAELAQAGMAPEYCYGPIPLIQESTKAVEEPTFEAAIPEEPVASKPFTDSSLATHSMTIRVTPQEPVVVPIREILPVTMHFTPFAATPIASGCIAQLVSDPRVMLTRDQALARGDVPDEGDLFADDGYYNNDYDCVWAGIQGAMCGKGNDLYGKAFDSERYPTAAKLQAAVSSKQSCATDSSWIGCDEASALSREDRGASLKSQFGTERAAAPSADEISAAAANLLKRLGTALAELGQRIEELETSEQVEHVEEHQEPVRQQALLEPVIDNTVNTSLPYLGL